MNIATFVGIFTILGLFTIAILVLSLKLDRLANKLKHLESRIKPVEEECFYKIDPDLRDNLARKLDALIEMADELTTGNVAHKKAAIKGFTSRMKEWLIKSTQV